MSAWTAAAVMVAIGVGVGAGGVRLEQRMPQRVAHARIDDPPPGRAVCLFVFVDGVLALTMRTNRSAIVVLEGERVPVVSLAAGELESCYDRDVPRSIAPSAVASDDICTAVPVTLARDRSGGHPWSHWMAVAACGMMSAIILRTGLRPADNRLWSCVVINVRGASERKRICERDFTALRFRSEVESGGPGTIAFAFVTTAR